MSNWLNKSAKRPLAAEALPPTPRRIGEKMVRRAGEAHDAARISLLNEEAAEAREWAESEQGTLWAQYVLACLAHLDGHNMRAHVHVARGKSLPVSTVHDQHYAYLLESLHQALQQELVQISLAGKTHRISAALIVRDAERSLDRCLESIKSLVDEIVVVDTGSTDRTVEIATAQGAEIGHFQWCDDFAAARNAALELCSGDWVLSIDADEWLDKASLPILRSAISDTSCMYSPLIKNVGGGKQFSNPRLFPRKGARWSGRLHENVGYPAEPPMHVPLGDFVFHHDGYVKANVEESGKSARNQKVIDAIRAEDPSHAEILEVIELAVEAPTREDLIDRLKDVATHHCKPTYTHSNTVFKLLVNFLIEQQRGDEALEFARLADSKGLGGLWSQHLKARLAFMRGETELAKREAQIGLGFHDYEGDVEQIRRELTMILNA